MAILKMGALVEEIIGSLGGTAFKRQRGTQVMFRKSNGASRAKVLNNKTLGQKSQIFQSWGQLSTAEKAEWNFQTKKYKFANKFGVEVVLPGVQLQRKLQIQLSPYSMDAINPSTLDKVLKPFTIASAEIAFLDNEFYIAINTASTPLIIAVQVEIANTPLNAPAFIRRGIIYCNEMADNTAVNIYSELLAKYPFINSSYNLRVYMYEINPHGFVSVQQSLDVAVL